MLNLGYLSSYLNFILLHGSKLYICLVELAYCALLTAGCCCCRWWNGYLWLFGAIIGGVIGLIGSAFVASCWRFLSSTLGGVGVSGGIVCTLLSDCLGGGGVMLSRSGVASVMGYTFDVTVMGGIFTLGNGGAALGVETCSCLMPLWEPSVVVGPWCVEKFQLVVLTPAFEHRLCAHMVPPVPGCGGHVSVLMPL